MHPGQARGSRAESPLARRWSSHPCARSDALEGKENLYDRFVAVVGRPAIFRAARFAEIPNSRGSPAFAPRAAAIRRVAAD